METGLMLGGNIVSILIGQKILSQAITDASSSIYSMIGGIFYYSKSIDRILVELDIFEKVKTMETLVGKLCRVNLERDKAIYYSIESIHDMIMRIREDLKQLLAKVERHKKKWFNKYRSINIKEEVENLKLHCKLLDSRYDLLVKTTNISELLKNMVYYMDEYTENSKNQEGGKVELDYENGKEHEYIEFIEQIKTNIEKIKTSV